MSNCHSIKTALCNEVYVVCKYLSYLYIYKRANKGNASLSFLDAGSNENLAHGANPAILLLHVLTHTEATD